MNAQGFRQNNLSSVLCFALCSLIFFGSGYGQTFVNVAPSTGITGGYGMIIFQGGGGISFADFNNDGLDDLTFCTSFGQPMKFYKNNGSGFTLVSPPYVDNTQETRQVLWVDIDNDGDLDLFITAFLGVSRLYKNTGNMTFTDITAAAGLPTTTERTYGAAFGDYDRDGNLDLYISNYGPNDYGIPNFLYHNNGDLTFTDVTAATGTSGGDRQSFCSTFFDFDNNGTSDLYVVNDRNEYPNVLFAVDENGNFNNISSSSNADIAILSMNGGVGDYNNDGFLDIYVTNTYLFNNHCWLMHNNGDSTFTDSSATAGVLFNRFGWGGNFLDFDNDKDLDLYVCGSQQSVMGATNALYVNQGNGTFTEPLFATHGLGGIDTMSSFANVIGDYNNDGRLDIAVCNGTWGLNNWPFLLWKNDNINSNNWIKIKLIGHQSNRDAVGAMLEFWINGKKYIRFTHTANAYLGQNSRTIHFGMGTSTALDSLRIIWPSRNSVDVIPGAQLAINQTHTIEETCGDNLVTIVDDNGTGTLRAAISCASPGDTIYFDNSLAGDTILLSTSKLTFFKDVVLYSTAVPKITIKSAVAGAIDVQSAAHVSIHNLNIISGSGGNPAAIKNAGTLNLHQTNVIRNPTLTLDSKLVNNTGTLRVFENCTIDQ